jgi:hypothetical protein
VARVVNFPGATMMGVTTLTNADLSDDSNVKLTEHEK